MKPSTASPTNLSQVMPPWGGTRPHLATPTATRMAVSTPTLPSRMAHRNVSPPSASATTRALPPPVFNADLNTQYSYSSQAYLSASPAPPLHRGALPFVPGSALEFNHTDADIDEIITSGSVAAASCPGSACRMKQWAPSAT
ncbi:hypothetical protein D1007_48823 [Hordeum vulgare]|nr:hypothetical protein D1007_48823 [Hordeum vulgare]